MKVVQGCVRGYMTSALNAWQDHRDQSHALKRITAKIQLRTKTSTLSMAWDSWVKHCSEDPLGEKKQHMNQAIWIKEAFGDMQVDLSRMLARIEAVEQAAAESVSVRFF